MTMPNHAGHSPIPAGFTLLPQLSRSTLGIVTVFFIIETAWSWTSVLTGSAKRADITLAVFSSVFVLILGRVALKSVLWADRIAAGAMAFANILIAATAARVSPRAIVAMQVAKSCMWTIATSVILIFLASKFGFGHKTPVTENCHDA